MCTAFVIQVHGGYGPTHYDLMLARHSLAENRDEPLATWRLAATPEDLPPGQAIAARKLPDHRAAYLAYEGPVRGGRGRVDILDSGTYELLAEDESRLRIRLAGQKVRGEFELRRSNAPEEWTVRRLSPR